MTTTTSSFAITSTAGAEMGAYEGRTPVEALVAMHNDAGYRAVRYDAARDEIVWGDAATAEICGDVDAWHIAEVSDAPDAAVALSNNAGDPTLVDDMDDDQIALCIHNAAALDADILAREDGAHDTDREYVAAYAAAHLARYGEVWTLP